MVNAFNYFEQIPIKTIKIDFQKALEIAWDYKIFAYDTCYLESAKRLRLPLLIFDGQMHRIGKELGITILGG
jgi:predicted nucleic acid-binding protein